MMAPPSIEDRAELKPEKLKEEKLKEEKLKEEKLKEEKLKEEKLRAELNAFACVQSTADVSSRGSPISVIDT